ncbi:MAG: multidrug efflux system membrane fusion protein [Janthinobacterium sp.]|jgi:multidrug efflux system membrane fusion protein
MDTQGAVTPPGQPGRSRFIGTLTALLGLAALGALAWHLTRPADPGASSAGGRRGMNTTTVGVATAVTADLPVTLDALGTVTAVASVTLRPQVSGILQKILFSEGQMVKAGQVLAMIDPRPFELALLQASGQRQRDEAQLENARLTLRRFQTLLAQDSIARQDVDTQSALVKQLEGTVMTDRAAEGVARLNLAYCKVTSPINGRVGLRVVDAGNLVNASDAAGIAVITQLSPIDVVFSVPQDRAAQLQASVMQGAQLAAVALDRTRVDTLGSGRFAALDNVVDVQTGTVRAKARFANDALALFPSQFVNLRLELRTIKDAVMVPVTALRHGSGGDFVYVLNALERTVALRPVTRGQASASQIEIKTGLKAGEKVITEGADRLKDGAKVNLPGDKPRAAGAGGRSGADKAGAGRAAKAQVAPAAAGTEAAGEPARSRAAAASAPAAAPAASAPSSAPVNSAQ